MVAAALLLASCSSEDVKQSREIAQDSSDGNYQAAICKSLDAYLRMDSRGRETTRKMGQAVTEKAMESAWGQRPENRKYIDLGKRVFDGRMSYDEAKNGAYRGAVEEICR